MMRTDLAVVESSVDIDVTNGGALTHEQVEATIEQLDRWTADNDSESLNEARAQSDAASVYAKRNGYTKAADQYSRLKLHCEARLGQIDRRINPSLPKQTPWLEMGEIRIDPTTRRCWRTLAIVAERQLLDGFLDELDEFTWNDVRREMSRRGLAWASCAPILVHVKKNGLKYKDIADKCGMDPGNLRDALHQSRMRWSTALRICEAIEFDAFALPPDPSPRIPGRQAAWAKRRREAEAALARERERKEIRRALKGADKALAEAYAMAERMQDVIGQAHRGATDSEARRALSLAGEHHRKMRDEIVRALGVGS